MMKPARVFPLALVVLFASFVFLQNVAPAQAVPDLVVTNAVRIGSTVCFTVLNQGSSQADKGHATALYANGKLLDKEVHLGNLNPWESAKGCFGVAADGHPISSLTVCADADQAINESKENNNCLAVTEPSQDTQAPVISKVTVSDITATSAKVSWGTDESADSRVVYGRDARLFASQEYSQDMALEHELTLSGLTPGATYACKAISSDGSANSAQSKTHYFQTLAGGEQKPDIQALSSLYAKGSLPPQFHVDTPDTGADRVAFFCNDELVGIDYTAPFSFSLFPDFLDQTAADLIGSNSVGATIFGRDGQSSTMMATMDLAESCLTSGVQVRIDAPDPQVLYTNGTTAEPGEVQLWVTAVEPGEIEFAPHPRGPCPYGSGGGGPTTSFIHDLRFFVDGDEIFPTDLGAWGYDEDIHIFTFNPSGLPLGEHRVRVEATASSGCRFVSTTSLTVAERHAQIDVARQVTREGSSFRVQLDITNVGQARADVSLLSDSMVGFMPSRTTSTQEISFDEHTLSGSIDCNDPIPFGGELDPGESHSIHFYAVPILFESDPDYRFGDSVRVVYTDHTGQWFDETLDLTTERTDTAHLDLALETALNASDYLMVTDPSNLLAQNDRGDVMELFNWTSMLARERNAVLGFYDSHVMLRTNFSTGDLLALGNIFIGAESEITVGDMENDQFRIYDFQGQHYIRGELPHSLPFDLEDRMAMGNVLITDRNSDPHDREEILVARALGGFAGRVTAHKYRHDPNRGVFTSAAMDTSFGPGDEMVLGNVRSGGAGGAEEEVLIVNADGRVDVHQQMNNAVVESFSTSYNPGDNVATGNICGNGYIALDYDEVVVACHRVNRLMLYGRNAGAAGIDRLDMIDYFYTLDPGDCLAVGDVSGDDYQEILVADHAQDQIVVYGYNHATGRLELQHLFNYHFEEGDRLLAGNMLPGGKDEILVFRHGQGHSSHTPGEVEIVSYFEGETPGDRYGLRRQIIEEWGPRLAGDFLSSGHLLILGESDIIPAFFRSWSLAGNSAYGDVRYTDRDYADTDNDRNRPELAVGRIIGNSAADMTGHIRTSLDLYWGGSRLDNDNALAVSGYNEGASGSAADIDFVPLRNSCSGHLEGMGCTTTTLHTPDSNETLFFDLAADKDFIHLVGHGGTTGWDIIHRDEVLSDFQPGDTAPVVFAASCLTGHYAGRTSLAEAFLSCNASAYIGSTEVTFGGEALANRLYDELYAGNTLGQAMRTSKRARAAAGRRDERAYNRYHNAVYHLYGDPKIGIHGLGGRLSAETRYPAQKGPLATLEVSVPPYSVDSQGGYDHVFIPGQDLYQQHGRPEVPRYTVRVSYPAGSMVQEVTLLEKGGLETDSGLTLPVYVPEPYGSTRAPRQGGLSPGWWPRDDFEWSVYQEPDGSTLLVIGILPFQYDAATGEARFYTEYLFDIDFLETEVSVNRLMMEQDVFQPGEMVTADAFVRNTSQSPQDVIVEAAIMTLDEGQVFGLPLRTLTDLTGLASLSLHWDSSGKPPGSYQLQMRLRDTQGRLLDTAVNEFLLGSGQGRIAELSATPDSFGPGASVAVSALFVNTGTTSLNGTLHLAVQDDQGSTLAAFSQPFPGLEAGQSETLSRTWTADRPSGGCRLVASAAFEGKTTEPVILYLPGFERLFFPHVASDAQWETEVAMINTGDADFSGVLRAYAGNGSAVGSLNVQLPTNGRKQLTVGTSFPSPQTIRYLVLEGASGGVCGYTKFFESGGYRGALPASAVTAADDLPICHIASDPQWWTGIGLVNTSDQDKTLTLRCSTGQTSPLSIPSRGQKAFLVKDLFGGTAQPGMASAVLEGAQGLVGLELFGQGWQLGGIRLSDRTAPTLYFPHLHSDAVWWTGLVVYNPWNTPTALTVTPYTATGTALPPQSVSIGPKGKYVGFARNLGLPATAAWLRVTASQPVSGFELFGTWDTKLLAGFSALDLARTTGVFPKLEEHGWTGIAFVNTTGSPIEVTLTAYDDSGTQVAVSSLTLAANAKRVDFAEDLFAGDISTATYVAYTSTGNVAGFQLNGSTDGWLLDGLPGM